MPDRIHPAAIIGSPIRMDNNGSVGQDTIIGFDFVIGDGHLAAKPG
jgi:hypothetical protein